MPAALLLAFLVIPLVELAVILQVRGLVGLPLTLALLFAVSLVGASLVRREGTRAWRALIATVGNGRPPTTEAADGALVLLGGALLLTPGFVTDAAGLLLVLPPSRAVVRRLLSRWIARRLLSRRRPIALRFGRQVPAGRSRPGRHGAGQHGAGQHGVGQHGVDQHGAGQPDVIDVEAELAHPPDRGETSR